MINRLFQYSKKFRIKTKLIYFILISFVFVVSFHSLLVAQSVKDYGINIRSTLDTINRKITFNWDADTNAYNYFIYKKKTSDSLFGDYIAKLPKEQIEWSDTLLENVEIEYKIEKDANFYYSYGYIIAGLNIEEKHYFGTCLILVDSTIYSEIYDNLMQFANNIRADGWQVKIKKSPRAESFDPEKVRITKDIIIDTYKNTADLTSVILIGRIPVHYSGNFAVDGHEDHYGAWPTDVYYAELDGKWTDTLRSRFDDVDNRIRNLPNDGKTDQTYLTSDLELQIGRIDMYDLPYFKESEVELINRYLSKINEFKKGKIKISNRAAIVDNFGPDYKEGFASNGWTNFYALVGSDNITYLNKRFQMQKEDFLWYYGCGPGTYTASHEVLYSQELAINPHLVAFNMLFGSYNGDWDSKNNLLRATIASQPLGFTAVWAGRPHWFFHHLAYSYNIGYSTKLTQNAFPANYTAVSPFARRMNHIALMGDPTLRMYYFEKPENVKVNHKEDKITILWDYPEQPNVTFNVYRSNNIDGKFEKINKEEITSNFFEDNNPLLGNNIYQVRAKRKDIAQAGTYYNLSIGDFSENIKYTIDLGKELIVTPNPFIDKIIIAIKDDEIINRIELFDINGLKILEKELAVDDKIIELSLLSIGNSTIPSGVYLARIYTNKNIYDRKLLKY